MKTSNHLVSSVSFAPADVDALNTINLYLADHGKTPGRTRAVRFALRHAARQITAETTLAEV